MARKTRRLKWNEKTRSDCPALSTPASEKRSGKKAYLADGYVRLSDRDAGQDISDSVINQSRLIAGFIKERRDIGLNRILTDDGKTGTNFKRDGFSDLMRDIRENGVNCVIVKDLSRLGRDYVETGRLLEQTFPMLGVRFISVLDGYDSLDKDHAGSFLVPLKNVTNQEYSMELSEKVKCAKRLCMEEGKNVSPLPPYGYIKKDGVLSVDPYAARAVRQMAGWILSGKSLRFVCRELERQEVLPPKRYFYELGFLRSARYGEENRWHTSTVKRILLNDTLLGDTVQGKYYSPYLRAPRKNRSREEWFVRKNTHPALLDRQERKRLDEILERKENGKSGEQCGKL